MARFGRLDILVHAAGINIRVPADRFTRTDYERLMRVNDQFYYARRDGEGQFTNDQTDVGKSSAADQRQHSKTPAKKGQGDRGDRQA